MSEDALQYPKYIAKELGVGVNRVNSFKHQGCRFLGKKTSMRWVKEYLAKATESCVAPSEHLQHSGANKPGESA